MNESSLPPFEPARFRLFPKVPPSLFQALGRLLARASGRRDTASTRALESRAAHAIREYLRTHAESVERAARLEEKAERLEKAGTPSESARNRAERARGEVVGGLVALKVSFVEATDKRDGACAFDRAVELLCPAFALRRAGRA